MVTRIHKMSDEVIGVMNALRYNDRLVNLLVIDENDTSFTRDNRPDGFDNTDNHNKKNLQVVNQSSRFCRISPTPFNPEAQEKDMAMVRVYYNQGEFNSEIITESTLHIDIIVAKSLWLIYDQSEKRQIIRPYEIMDCVIDTVGRKGFNPLISVDFTGYQHLAVNTKFDAIRIYSEDFSPDLYESKIPEA